MAEGTRVPLSVFIIAKNEEQRIGAAIRSVKALAAEVIVVEAGSIDKTVEVAQQAGARVLHHPWQGYGPQKIFAERVCQYDWVLNLDADEALTSALATEIRTLFQRGDIDRFYAYKMRVTNTLWYEQEPKKWADYINRVRLYHRQKASFRHSTVHDCVVLNGTEEGSREEDERTLQLSGRVIHRSILSIAQKVAKSNDYSTMQAENAVEQGTRPSMLKITFASFFVFLKFYFLKRYMIYGRIGVILAGLEAFSAFLKYCKIQERYIFPVHK